MGKTDNESGSEGLAGVGAGAEPEHEAGDRASHQPGARRDAGLSWTQATAWSAANMSYHVPRGEAYRAYARELYEQDLHDRIVELFTRLDEQNVVLEEALLTSAGAEQTCQV